ncbi:hypothetical protein, partial [Staphylococcus aureus]|uniref:hypothetical protein n=1 Tax=Staphylococcus aureus TaxID=1280 RepID=UPI001F2AA7DE
MTESDELDIRFNSNHFQHYMMFFYGNGTEMIFSQNLFRRPTPTCIVCRNWESNFSVFGPHPNL